MDRNIAVLIKQDLVVAYCPSLWVLEMFWQSLPVRTNGANCCHVELRAKLPDQVVVRVASVHSEVATFELVALCCVLVQTG
jgi:hypothetical protein